MPRINFSDLPAASRVWVFACEKTLVGDQAAPLLSAVDAYLDRWHAHGAPLRSAREWRDDRFLAVGIDPTAEQASGCSIDGLFRSLREIGASVGTQVLAGGRVFYRSADGSVRAVSRKDFSAAAAAGDVTGATPVFDTSVIRVQDWRGQFERPAGEAWTAELLAH